MSGRRPGRQAPAAPARPLPRAACAAHGTVLAAAVASFAGAGATPPALASGQGALTSPAALPAAQAASAWPWAFAGLAVAGLLLVAWLAWRLGLAQARARALEAPDTTRFSTSDTLGPATLPAAGAAAPALADTAAALAALAQTLDLHDGPALMLAVTEEGPLRLQHLNAAALALWPQARPGAPATALQAPAKGSGPAAAALTRWLADPPSAPAVLPALGALPAPAGWRGTCVALAPQGATAWVLLLPAPGGAAADLETEQFSFTLSHDLRAPIRVVEGFTRIVKEDYGTLLDRVGNDHLDRVLGAAARMNQMIDALLTLARLSRQPLSRQPVNLSQLAGWVADELRRTAPERAVRIEIAPDLQAIGDPTLLRLVLENLLGNAWKYSSRNELSVIRFDTVPHGDGLAYRVQDNGAGFDMRGAERLFGLFQRLHSASEFPGTGVGLASVRRIVQRHGGEIWAEAEPGRGASFCFTLAQG